MDPVSTVFSTLEAPGKVIKAAIGLKKLYDAFFNEHRSATREARDFAQLVTTFSLNLVHQGRLIRRAGKFFPGEENFERTIEQCTTYLHNYESLLREQAHPMRRAMDIASWQSDLTGDRKALIDKLNIHINFMNSFSMSVLLEIALKDHDGLQQPAIPAGESTAIQNERTFNDFEKSYNDLYMEIVSLGYRQKRDRRLRSKPDFITTELKPIIEKWRKILIDSGMPALKLPEIPDLSDQDTLDSIGYRWRRDIAREQSLHSRSPSEGSRAGSTTPRSRAGDSGAATPTSRRPSLDPNPNSFPKPSPHHEQDMFHSPIDGLIAAQLSPGISPNTDPRSRSPSVFSYADTIETRRTANTDLSLDPRRGSLTSIANSLGRLSVSDPQPVADVKWKGREKHTLRLRTLDYDDVQRFPRSITWNKDSPDQFEHRLSRQANPFTWHSRYNNHALDVSFLEEQDLKHHRSYKSCPTYTFHNKDHYTVFQSLVYGRHLLHTFDVSKISSATSSRQGEATDQHVKIWRSIESSRHYLTFFGNALEPPKFRVLLVTWFDRPDPDDNPKSKTSIRLTVHKRSRTPSGPGRRLSDLSKLTKSRTGSMSSQSPGDQELRRASVASHADDAHACPEEILRLGYLDMQFAKLEERNSFVSAFAEAIDGTPLGNANTTTMGHSPTIPETPVERDPPDDRRSVISFTPSVNSSMTAEEFARRRATPGILLGIRPPL